MIFSIRTDTKEWKQDRESRNKSTCKQSIYDKGTMNIMGKNIFLTKRYSGNTGEPHAKENGLLFYTTHKIQFKMDQRLNLKSQNHKARRKQGYAMLYDMC